MTPILFGQITNPEDYKIYAAIMKSEIPDSAKSVTIIKYGIESKETFEATHLAVDNLKSKDLSRQDDVYSWTEDKNKNRPVVIDSVNAVFLMEYCGKSQEKFTLTNLFNQPYKTILISKFPIRVKSVDEDWKSFYERYPDSWGIFSFSNISYYCQDANIAVTYYWHRSHGLDGHGALTVMEKINGEWQVRYKTYLWWN